MLNHIAIILILISFFICDTVCKARPIRIVGEGQLVLINLIAGTQDIVETASLVIVVDGPLYRISSESIGNGKIKDEFGSDGIDTFLLSDRPGPFNRDGKGWSGFAFPGRLPRDCSSIIQAAWLGYCSRDYFNLPTNSVGLKLNTELLSWCLPENVTNTVTYWPGTTLPQEIKGWSRNWVQLDRNNIAAPVELKQYTQGFKAWTFTANNEVIIGATRLPHRIAIECYIPKPPKTATTGDDTQLIRKVIFVASSIEEDTNSFDSLPPIGVAGLSIIDRRFEDITGNYLVISKSTSNSWPTHLTKGFQQASADANQIVFDHNIGIKSKSSRAQAIAITILGINLIAAIVLMAKLVFKKAKMNNKNT